MRKRLKRDSGTTRRSLSWRKLLDYKVSTHTGCVKYRLFLELRQEEDERKRLIAEKEQAEREAKQAEKEAKAAKEAKAKEDSKKDKKAVKKKKSKKKKKKTSK